MVDLNVNLCLTTFESGGQHVKGQKTNFIKTEAKSLDIGYQYRPSAKKIHIGQALFSDENAMCPSTAHHKPY